MIKKLTHINEKFSFAYYESFNSEHSEEVLYRLRVFVNSSIMKTDYLLIYDKMFSSIEYHWESIEEMEETFRNEMNSKLSDFNFKAMRQLPENYLDAAVWV